MKKILCSIPFALFLLLIIFKPHGIVYYHYRLDELWKIFLVILAIFITIIYIKENKLDKFIIFSFIYMLIVILSTFYNEANYEFCLSKLLPSWIALIYSTIFIKVNPLKFLKSLYIFSIFIAIANLISIYMNPEGIGTVDYYFLGLDNMAAMNLIMGGLFIWLYRHITHKNKFITFLLLLIPVYQLFYVDCSTGKVGAAILLILFIFFDFIKNIKLLNYKNYIIISLLLFVFIVILRFQNYFEFLIVDILHKDLTFTLRTFIWDDAILSIKENYLLGIGYSYAHFHCTYLDTLAKFGTIGFIAYLINLFIINKKITIEEKKDDKTRYIAKIISFGFLIYFLMTIVEVYLDNQFFYVLLALGYYSNIICNIELPKKKENI